MLETVHVWSAYKTLKHSLQVTHSPSSPHPTQIQICTSRWKTSWISKSKEKRYVLTVWMLNSMLAMQKKKKKVLQLCKQCENQANWRIQPTKGSYLGLFLLEESTKSLSVHPDKCSTSDLWYFMNSLTLTIKEYEDRTTQWGDSEGCRSGETSLETKWQYGNSKYILNRTEWIWLKLEFFT